MKEIPVDVSGDKVKLIKNAPPTPTIVKFVFDETDKPIHIFFQYDNKIQNGAEIMEWLRQYSEAVTGRLLPPKETLVFDGEFYFEDHTLHVFDMLLKNADIFDPVSDDCIVLNMEISYDHYRWDL